MKIGILGAMVEEIEPLLEYYKNYKSIKIAKNTFYIIKQNENEIIIAYSKIGKVNASLTASVMILNFGVQKILFTGVAGAINKDLKIGNLLYADKLAQHDLDITAFGHPYGYVPEGSVFVKSDDDLNSVAKEVAKEKNISLKSAVVATGDQFISSNEDKSWIEKIFKADALEMEGAAVAVVCDALSVPFFVLRAISDAADTDASFDFDEFLKSSSRISASFLISMINKIK